MLVAARVNGRPHQSKPHHGTNQKGKQMPATKEARHLTIVAPPAEAAPLPTVPYTTWAAGRVQDFAEHTHDENPLTVALECGIFLGHPVDVTDLCDLADALEDVRTAEDPHEARLRQPSVDELTAKILRTGQCAVTL